MAESEDPPPRRKSCIACGKAKRRCNLTLPACHRCSERKLECRYPSKAVVIRRTFRAKSTRNKTPAAQTSCSELPLALSTWSPLTSPSSHPDVAVSFLGAPEDPETTSAPNFGLLDYMIDNDDDPIDEILRTTGDSLSRQQSLALPSPSLLVFGSGDVIDPFTFSVAKRLQYAIDEITRAPQNMALENQTPWCHPLLYRDCMPRTIQSMELFHSQLNSAVRHVAK